MASRSGAADAHADQVVDESRASIRDGIARLAHLDGFPAGAQLRTFERAWKREDALLLQARRLSATQPERAAALFDGRQGAAATTALAASRRLDAAVQTGARDRNREVQDAYASSSLFLLGSIALAAVLGLGDRHADLARRQAQRRRRPRPPAVARRALRRRPARRPRRLPTGT